MKYRKNNNGDFMKISWLKAKGDDKSFKFQKSIGFDVFEIEDLENTDEMLTNLVNNEYSTIVVSNEVASFSTDIIKKYAKNDNVNIIITRNKEK